MSERKRPPKVNLRAPQVAWWTLSLLALCVSGWLLTLFFVLRGSLGYTWGFVFSTLAIFVAFTPMHDASHRSVARQKWVNEVVGRVCSFMFFSPFPAFRYVHLEHHKHTNHPEKDPDFWSGRGPSWLLPFRWITQDMHYYVVYLGVLKQRPKAENREVVLGLVGFVSALFALMFLGWGKPALLLWVLPGRLAIAMLAFSFDYLPHVPHKVTSAENRYKATLVRPSPLLTPVLLYQNFHLIHHLYPGVPFYRYAEIWRTQREFLLEQGVEMRSLTGKVLTTPSQPPEEG
jgi:fatty acid desaturase